MIFALPITIADLSARRIPNIYLYLYSYLTILTMICNGFENLTLTLGTGVLLLVLNVLGMGMGDAKLIFLISILSNVGSSYLVAKLLTLILLCAGVNILISWGISKAFPVSIAMAPAIFMGTGLYLATKRA